MRIREERRGDEAAIAALLEAAFGGPDEARLVEALRRDGDVFLSLVAEQEKRIVGHILLSPLRAPFFALALAPLAVAEGHRSAGIGRALIETAAERAEAAGARAIFVLGEPVYYGRFGFRADLAAEFQSPYAGPFFMARPLGDGLPIREGRIDHAPAFADLS